MIVIGVDVHKHELTAVAVDELGRELSSWSGPLAAELCAWGRSLDEMRLWALEDCRHVSRAPRAAPARRRRAPGAGAAEHRHGALRRLVRSASARRQE
jgi:hypothetical protein